MANATQNPASTAKVAAAPKAAPPPPQLTKLTREQVDIEMLVDRYLNDQLTARQKMELEAFCRDNPQFIDEIKLSARMHAGLKLIESSGRPEPWNENPLRWWQTHWFAGAAVAVLLAALVGLWQFNSKINYFSKRAADAEKRLSELPLTPAATSRTVRVTPVGKPSAGAPMFTLGGGEKAEFVTMEFDFSRSNYGYVDLELERIDQGRVAILRGLRRNSNGIVSWSLNSSALGPGTYIAHLYGLDWRAHAWMAGGVAFEVAPRRR